MPTLSPDASSKSEVFANIKQRFLKAVGGSVILKVFSAIAKLAVTVALAKILGAQGFGLFTFVLSLISLASIPLCKGIPNLVARNVAIYQSLSNWGAMRGLLLRGNQLVMGLSLLIIIIAVVASLYFVKAGDLSTATFLVALIILPCVALSGIRRGALIGLHRPVTAQVPEQFVQPALFIVLIGASFLLIDKSEFTPLYAMSLRVITVIVELVLGYILLARFLPQQIKQYKPSFETSGWLRGAFAFMLIGGMGTINSEISILMLGTFGVIEDVGIYKSAAVLALLVTFILQSINTSLLPFIAKLYTEGQMERLQKMITLSCRLVVLCGLPAALVLIFFGEKCLQLLYGDEFIRGATALTILSVGLLLNTATGPVGLLLNTSGYEMDTIKGKTIGMVLNVILCALFIPKWGLEGAAWATTCSLLTWNVYLVFIVRKRLDIHPTVFGNLSFKRNSN